MILRSLFAALALLAVSIPVADARDQPHGNLTGEVVRVTDGDTVTLLTPDHEQVRVRLADIDAPESRQPYGNASRQELASMVFRRKVRVEVVDTDRYGRTVGRLSVGGLRINAELVRRGAAWVYPAYNRDPALPGLEAEARAARRGLWRLQADQREAPWEWRRERRGR